MNLSDIPHLLTTYQYFILFPLSIIEGPILTVVAAFLTTLGIMKLSIVYLVVVLGDVVGDTVVYSIGRWGGSKLGRFEGFLRITPEKIESTKEYFNAHYYRAIFVSKFFHGIGAAGLLTAGILKTPYLRYILLCSSVSAIQSGALLFLGVVFGHMYVQISKYMDYYAMTMTIIGLVAIALFILYKSKKFSPFSI